jgi:hypothetical protein
METTTIKTTTGRTRHTAINALAIVGFIVLVILGMALAVYAARFVPETISRVGSAAVYLSSQVFSPDGEADLEVVPGTETVPFGDDVVVVATSTPTTTPATTPTTPAPTTPGTPVTTVVQVGTNPATYSGLPDLVLENVQTGYLTGTNVSTFRASNNVPDGERGAVKFTIANRGTNIAGDFEFQFRINTSPSINKDYKVTRELRPGERIEYTLWFDRVRSNDDRTISLEIDTDNEVRESNENNNDKTTRIDIEN